MKLPLPALLLVFLLTLTPSVIRAQVTTTGFLNQARPEAPGTLLSAPWQNGSQNLGRTTTLSYVNGWLIVGGESPGSAPGSDLIKRVYDISNPTNPVRRHPSDFGLVYPNNLWIQNDDGWNAHGTAQSGPYTLPGVMRVQTFGGPVELGGTNGIPMLSGMPLLYNRSSQAGPWSATLLWYSNTLPASGLMEIRRPRVVGGMVNAPGDLLASWNHVGDFGGGDWHPMFFGDLLIYARSGLAANDGVVVYRLSYTNFEDGNPANDQVGVQYVGSLEGGFQGYWPNLFSDGTGLYVIGSATDILTSANITNAADPATSSENPVVAGPTLTIPGFTNASYPVYQDRFAFIHNRKIDMTEFLADAGMNSIALTLNEAATGVDTTQMSLPLGNLWITGGYPNGGVNAQNPWGVRSQGMAVWVHQQDSDETAPAVSYHIPQNGRANYPRFAPLSFLLHEHPRHGGLRNGIDFAVRPVGPDGTSLGAAVPGYLIHDFSGVVTFTPQGGLAANTTYQVDFFSDDSNPANPIGFFDAAGNVIEPYTFRFSTGGGVAASPAPVFSALTASDYQPAPGESLTVTATATPGTPGGSLQYRFNFTGTWSAWGAAASANHSYNETGRQRVLVQVREGNGAPITRPLNLLVTNVPAGPQPTRSSTITSGNDGPAGHRVWVVNPDADTVTVFDALTNEVDAELAVGDDPRSIARDANGRYWVTCQGSDEIRVFNADTTPHATVTVPYGSAPFGIAPSPDGEFLFVTLYGSGRLHRYTADTPATAPTVRTTFPTPRAIAVSGDGERVLVTRFLSPDLEAEIGEFDGNSPALDAVRTFRLSSSNTIDLGDRASGVPNYLAGIAISPDGTRAAVVSKQDNIQRGELFGVNDLTFETTVRAVVSFLDLQANAEIRHSRRDFDNSDSPSAVSYTPLGDTLLVTLQGNNRVVGFDALSLAPVTGPNTVGATLVSPVVKTLDANTGAAPQGLLVDPVSGRLFVQNFLGRSVTVLDAGPLLTMNQGSLPNMTTVDTVANEPLPLNVFLGKQIFYHAADPRMSADSYISCASCHVDGGHDGRVWDFTGRGEGLRRTIDLRGRGGMAHGNVHWSANFDEIQDFEHDIRGPFGGTGFLPLNPVAFATQHGSPASTKAGLSADLDALAAYVASLGNAEVPRSPHRNTDGSLTAAALRGRDLFVAQNCVSCHSGDDFTDSNGTPTLHSVGTLSALSGERLGQPLAGIDTPTLIGLHAARRYLHHGLGATLNEVFSQAGGVWLPAANAQFLGGAAVGTGTDNPAEGGGGFTRGVFGGQLVGITGAAGNGVRFNNVDGGTGGTALITLRYVRQYSGNTATFRVNGVNQSFPILIQEPDNNWMVSGWRWASFEVPLNAGATNTIEVLRESADLLVNGILVANANVLAAAAPHRVVTTLSSGDRDDLLAYLRQLDGSPGEAPAAQNPANPSVTITTLPGFTPPLTEDFIDFDIVFSAPVTGLVAGDFILGGTALPTTAQLTTLTAGTHYRLRVGGFTGAGSITLQLPAGAVDGLAGGSVNNASLVAQVDYAPVVPDDLAPLSDEFDNPDTITHWLRNETVEGWGGSKLEQYDIDTTSPGHMRLMPYSSSWYEDFTGAYTYKEVTGDFVLTTRLDVTNRAGTGRPNSDFSLAGLMVRAPRGLTNAAPSPDPGPGTFLPWPPPAQGQPNHYTTPWQPDTENYIFLSFGFGSAGMATPDGGNPNRWHYEVKTTTNGVSTLYPRTHGVPENEPVVMLQMVRRGSTFLLLRRHGEGPWIIENRFERADLPTTLQIGMTTYTDWNTVAAGWDFSNPRIPFHQNRIVNTGGTPDLIADVDFVRIRRPDPALDAAALQAASVTGPNGPVVNLAGTPLAAWLGDNGHAPFDNGGDPEPLPAPTGITANFVEGEGVVLSWDAVAGATGYEVWSGGSSNPASLAHVGTTATTGFAHAAASGQTHYYSIRATNAGGPGSFSNPASTFVTIPLAVPTNVTANFVEGEGVVLSWSAVAGATGYEIWGGPAPDAGSLLLLGTSANAGFVDTGVAPGDTRFYAIRATNGNGPGAFSNAGDHFVEVPLPAPRPDLLIGTTLTKPLGDGIYNTTGANQRLILRSKGTRPLAAIVTVQNDGEGDDTIRLQTTRPSKTATLTAFLTESGTRTNVTATIVTSGALTGTIAPGDSRRLDLSIRPGKRFAGANLRIAGETRGTSDAVMLQISRPPRKR
ncbi:MAG: Ig-like domain-containing protein [Verrucomicrobiales bacterium]|nr:Ig-like domain-containing protein [Verrucomicrobiales bacterium]